MAPQRTTIGRDDTATRLAGVKPPVKSVPRFAFGGLGYAAFVDGLDDFFCAPEVRWNDAT
jgi:hypothetical protein